MPRAQKMATTAITGTTWPCHITHLRVCLTSSGAGSWPLASSVYFQRRKVSVGLSESNKAMTNSVILRWNSGEAV